MVYSDQLNMLLEELEDSRTHFVDMIDNIARLEIDNEKVEALRMARSYVSDMEGRIGAVVSGLRPSPQTWSSPPTWRPSLPSISETKTQRRDEDVDTDDDVMQPSAIIPDKPWNSVEQAARDAQIAGLGGGDKAPAKQCRVAEGHLPGPGSSATDVDQEADALPTSSADDTVKIENE